MNEDKTMLDDTGQQTEGSSSEPALNAPPLTASDTNVSVKEASAGVGATVATETVAPPVIPPSGPVAQSFVFHGRANEYFRIWIVNTLLTLLTCGVFLAWAKVRKRRYLRGNLELMGHRFDYRASPRRLLIGHLIMVAFFLGYSLFGVVYPAIRYGVLAVAGIMLPWIVVRSLTFNAHNTVYRGLRFRFNRSLSAAAFVFLLEPLLLVVTLGFYFPAWERSKRRYIISNHRLGDAYFHFEGKAGPFYAAYLLGGLMLFLAALLGGILLAWRIKGHPGVQPTLLEMVPFFIVYAFGFFVSRQFIYAQLFNHIWNHTRLDEHRFHATMQTGRWLGMQLTNLGAILVSCGLLYPWASMRAHRYAASCLSFLPSGPIDAIQRVGGSTGSAAGDTAAEFVGLDFGL